MVVIPNPQGEESLIRRLEKHSLSDPNNSSQIVLPSWSTKVYSQIVLTLGVIADTHIPDRQRALHAAVIPIFQKASVDYILHAGDISVPAVIAQLEAVAPVYAVRGNRDWLRLKELPITRVLPFEDITVGLTHGHGGMRTYLQDKINYIRRGPMAFRIIKERGLSLLPPDVDVVIFGHNHSVFNEVEDGVLIFNPGSTCCPIPRNAPPSVGLLHIDGSQVRGEILKLDEKGL